MSDPVAPEVADPQVRMLRGLETLKALREPPANYRDFIMEGTIVEWHAGQHTVLWNFVNDVHFTDEDKQDPLAAFTLADVTARLDQVIALLEPRLSWCTTWCYTGGPEMQALMSNSSVHLTLAEIKSRALYMVYTVEGVMRGQQTPMGTMFRGLGFEDPNDAMLFKLSLL